MIVGIGIDAVEVERFELWKTFSKEKLLKIFSEKEIEYCLENSAKSAERFAARFAAREAFFKAFCQMVPDHTVPFLTLCKLATVQTNQKGVPQLVIDWPLLTEKLGISLNPRPKCWLSITHTDNQSTTMVIIEELN